MGMNWNTESSLWTSGNHSSQCGCIRAVTGYPERLWSPPPCKYSKTTWTAPCDLAWVAGQDWLTSRGPLQPQPFYDSMLKNKLNSISWLLIIVYIYFVLCYYHNPEVFPYADKIHFSCLLLVTRLVCSTGCFKVLCSCKNECKRHSI